MEARKSPWTKIALAAVALVMTVGAQAQQRRDYRKNNHCVMIPPNHMLVGKNSGTGISEEMFNKVIDAVESVYAPIIKAKGANLVVDRNWDDNTVNAYASRSGNTWHVAMFGGLARHPETTPDGFAMVVCHELGHHIGGLPKYGNDTDWAATEGQSDYFASLKCTRRVLEKINNVGAFRQLYKRGAVDPLVDQRCKLAFPNQNEYAICLRGSLGGKALARLLADLGGEKMPEFNTPDTSKVKKTNEAHPAAQCRLDTYFAGAVCPVPFTVDVSDKDPNVGVCTPTLRAPNRRLQAAVEGSWRPACWYAPKAARFAGMR